MKRDAFTLAPDDVREIRHFHLFCGLGGGAKGFNKASPRVGNMVGKFRCIGGVDVDPAAIRDFQRLTGTPGTVLDLFDRSQYQAFHGMEPPAGWREVGPAEIRAAAGGEYPHIVFLSAPCKGFSGLLSENRSRTDKYQALNRLTLRGIWLMLEAFADEPPELIVFENVPRIANRGRHLLDQIGDLLQSYGYAVAETTHDCGELGALAQSRKRFLLVARHVAKVQPFLYEPEKKSLAAVGTVLDRMPLPGDPAGGPMHRIPRLQWQTWVRLAFVEAGSDWRSLNRLAVEDGVLRDFLIVPEHFHNGYMGVNRWEDPMGTVRGRSLPLNGAFSVADPRYQGHEYQQYGVRRWEDTCGAVSSQSAPGGGAYSVADPRHTGPAKHSNEFRIVPWSEEARAVTGAHGSGQCVADPRRAGEGFGKYMVTGYRQPAGTVISGSTTGQGAYAVADPRPSLERGKGDHYLTGGHYGVAKWEEPSGAVSAAACHDNGRWSVADPRMPAAADNLVAVIRALDGTWHRPFTTLELAALQSLVDPEEHLELDGLSDSDWRERIGNAVPPDAAQAIAGVMGTTLLLAWSGETFMLSSAPIWVRPVAVALSVAQGGAA
ncbi:site-specific DNA methylase [Azospira oryzae PS]|uniref:Site-specific DNA methylase n=1 Tax=Azospira oryzae (strain ATCC BAA-33 / DSM 13638 / PS) TaxID=640081 RepID=G8QM77_AZOOP|nr:DNA cytosine methyltransferase [Azospira oryzae]AEV24593.1 site-specific DNA methylase [Azospira oryzae PS]